MKILVIILLLIGLACFLPGTFTNSFEKSYDDRNNEAFLGLLGIFILAIDFVIFIVWQLFKA